MRVHVRVKPGASRPAVGGQTPVLPPPMRLM